MSGEEFLTPLVTRPSKKCKILVQNLAGESNSRSPQGQTRLQLLTLFQQFNSAQAIAAICQRQIRPLTFFSTFVLFESSDKKGDLYNILWALLFGFATLNILGLGAKRFEPHHDRMSFGEVLAVGTVIVAVFLLGWEMLYLFKILPIRLSGH